MKDAAFKPKKDRQTAHLPQRASAGPNGLAITPSVGSVSAGIQPAPLPFSGVIQGVFEYDDGEYDEEKPARSLAKTLYTRLSKKKNIEPKIESSEFEEYVVDLAITSQDYGELTDSYFQRLIVEGKIPEKFSFRVNKRRIETVHEPKSNYPPVPSFFQKTLTTKGQRQDFSYNDLRIIMDKVIAQGVTEEEIDEAITLGVQNFDLNKSNITLDSNYNTDLQLLAHHLLKYQSFNRKLLKDLPKNKVENQYRSQELSKSKQIISTSPSLNLDKILPPMPNIKKGGLQDAMPVLLDLNRPLPDSIFGGETYKAVFVLAHKLYREAFDRSQKSLKKKKNPSPSEKFNEQRKSFNESFFDLLPDMDNSTIREGEGKKFMTSELGFTFNEDEDSFDEKDNSSSDEEDEFPDKKSIYNPNDNIFRAGRKRSTTLNSFALFMKMTGQKEFLDQPTEENIEKFTRLRRKTRRKSVKLNRKHQEPFETIVKEKKYFDDKIKLLDKMETKIDDETNQKSKSSRLRAKKRKKRVSQLRNGLNNFYTEKSVEELNRKRKRSSRWKTKERDTFGNLGPKKMKEFIFTEESSSESEPKARKKRKKSNRD